MRRKNHGKPIATGQGFSDFIVPLHGTHEIGSTEPGRDSMIAQYAGQPVHEDVVLAGMRKENFLRQGAFGSGHDAVTLVGAGVG